MTEEQEERYVAAQEKMAENFEYIAGALEAIATIQEATFAKVYPEKVAPAEATITHVKTEEERLRESQGSTGEPLVDWVSLPPETIGPREAAWIEKQKQGAGPK